MATIYVETIFVETIIVETYESHWTNILIKYSLLFNGVSLSGKHIIFSRVILVFKIIF